jgi:sulfane dehydrogenase subunit SoxC
MGGRPSPDAFGKVLHVAAPLQDSVGVITPSSLHYVATTRGSYIPDIDPKEHTLMIHGLVDRPLTLTMEDLKRLPSVTRLHFIECAGNRHNGRQKTVQASHGMTSCAEWTGVLLSTLLQGVRPEKQRNMVLPVDGHRSCVALCVAMRGHANNP